MKFKYNNKTYIANFEFKVKIEKIEKSIKTLINWIEYNKWLAYDPFDGLSSSLLGSFTFGNKYLRIVLQQTIRRFPFNLRPLVGVKPETSSKAMGFLAKGYLRLFDIFKKEEYFDKCKFCLNWLANNYSNGFAGYAWGNHFDYQSRLFYLPKGIPTVVWTALIADAFVDGYEKIGEIKYLDIAKSSCDFILNNLEHIRDSNGNICISYTPMGKAKVHNANMLAVSLLSRVWKHTGNKKFLDLARKALAYTMKCQRENGSWWYGEDGMLHWVDNFHTGYVLNSLYTYILNTGDESYRPNLLKGFDFYINNFFLQDGTPKYYDDKIYVVDIQCASQSIETLVMFASLEASTLMLAEKVAGWTNRNMQDKSGYFYFRKGRFFTNKTPMLHWGQATMFSAMSALLLKLKERKNEN